MCVCVQRETRHLCSCRFFLTINSAAGARLEGERRLEKRTLFSLDEVRLVSVESAFNLKSHLFHYYLYKPITVSALDALSLSLCFMK